MGAAAIAAPMKIAMPTSTERTMCICPLSLLRIDLLSRSRASPWEVNATAVTEGPFSDGSTKKSHGKLDTNLSPPLMDDADSVSALLFATTQRASDHAGFSEKLLL
jgi:hypothetical protein